MRRQKVQVRFGSSDRARFAFLVRWLCVISHDTERLRSASERVAPVVLDHNGDNRGIQPVLGVATPSIPFPVTTEFESHYFLADIPVLIGSSISAFVILHRLRRVVRKSVATNLP
jgi:hypothetical protein